MLNGLLAQLADRARAEIARADRPSMVRQIAEGLGYFRHGGFLLPMLAVAATINFGMLGVFAPRIVFLVRTEGAAPGTVGALISLSSLGGILGAALASRTVSRFGSARTYLAMNVATAPLGNRNEALPMPRYRGQKRGKNNDSGANCSSGAA